MFDPVAFDRLISGRRRGAGAAAARGLLRIAEIPYRWAVAYRNRRFDRGRRSVRRVPVPVVSVGNITAGGTGKTPVVAWLARRCRKAGVRVVLISRGYKSEDGRANDEARELHELLPDVPHLQNPDRVAAAREAIDRLGGQLIVLDDAFQHRRIHRDLDIVLIDALKPFGYEHLLPRGLLREPPTALARADVVALSRVDAVDDGVRRRLNDRIAHYAPRATRVELAHRPSGLVDRHGRRQPAAALAGRRVAAFCGIGNPAAFRTTLERLGCRLVAFRTFPDHWAYTADDIEALYHKHVVTDDPVDFVICTGKDLVKIGPEIVPELPIHALVIEIEVISGLEALEERLNALLQRVPGRT